MPSLLHTLLPLIGFAILLTVFNDSAALCIATWSFSLGDILLCLLLWIIAVIGAYLVFMNVHDVAEAKAVFATVATLCVISPGIAAGVVSALVAKTLLHVVAMAVAIYAILFIPNLFVLAAAKIGYDIAVASYRS